jgi:hypothetical protein
MKKKVSTYTLDADAELSELIASLSEEARVKVVKLFHRLHWQAHLVRYLIKSGPRNSGCSVRAMNLIFVTRRKGFQSAEGKRERLPSI